MFLRYFVELPLPAARVEAILLHAPGEWLPGLARQAEDRGERLLAEVGVGDAGRRVGRHVAMDLGVPTRLASKLVLPITWRPDGTSGALFPRLEADLEVGQLGPARTQLSISARYDPPLGLVGRVVDRALLHRVAEATVKDFMDRVGGAVEELSAAEPPGDPRPLSGRCS